MELLEDVMDCQREGDTGGQDQQAEKELHKYISDRQSSDLVAKQAGKISCSFLIGKKISMYSGNKCPI